MVTEIKELSRNEERRLRIEVLRERADLARNSGDPEELRSILRELDEILRNKDSNFSDEVAEDDSATDQAYLAKASLLDAVLKYLERSKTPQTPRQIKTALEQAGRKFENNKPVVSIRSALNKNFAKNDDLFHVAWGKWHLKSKYRSRAAKAKLEKWLEITRTKGTAGRSAEEHSKRTSAGLQAAKLRGKRIGAIRKMTPEAIESAKALVRNGLSAKEIAHQLGVSTASLYSHGVSPRKMKKGGELSDKGSDDTPQLRLVK